MESIISACIGFVAAILGVFAAAAFSRREWREQRKSEAYAKYFDKFCRCAPNPKDEDILELRGYAFQILLFAGTTTGKEFIDAVQLLKDRDGTDALEKQLAKLLAIARNDIK